MLIILRLSLILVSLSTTICISMNRLVVWKEDGRKIAIM